MNQSLPEIGLWQLALAFLPILPVIYIHFRWQLRGGRLLIALARMLGQLLLIGYLLTFLFAIEEPLWLLAVLSLMLAAAGWIALGVVEERWALMLPALSAMGLSVGLVLLLALVAIVPLEPWHQPRYLIPLAGMALSGAMNALSLCVERWQSDRRQGVGPQEARANALQAALIPAVNSLLAVGLVSLPGMMTGQILAGVSPLVAVRYQILIMCMLVSSAGLSVMLFLWFAERRSQS